MNLKLPLVLGSSLLIFTPSIYAQNEREGIYPDEITHSMPEDLSAFKQPSSFIADLNRIQNGSLRSRIKALAEKSRRDQVFVEGGMFQMGDFGRLQSKEQLPWDGNSNSSPLHDVKLDNYSISRYKVTLAEFDLYAEVNRVPTVLTEDMYSKAPMGRLPWRTPDKPAGVTWEQADAYCKWIGKITKQPFRLPTEAQWEYAARSRGQWIVYPTDNGKLEWNRNVPSYALVELINGGYGGWPYRPALFPPNSLGIYDMAKNSFEWVQDWYANDWYVHSDQAHNPTGPKFGTAKVLRSWPEGSSRAAMTMTRRSEEPGARVYPDDGMPRSNQLYGFRCATKDATTLEDH